MAVLKRELQRTAKGPVMNGEDWWRLAFDTDTKRLYVEHEWAYVDEPRSGAADSGTELLEIAEYLMQGGQTAGHRELWRLIRTLFEEQGDAAGAKEPAPRP